MSVSAITASPCSLADVDAVEELRVLPDAGKRPLIVVDNLAHSLAEDGLLLLINVDVELLQLVVPQQFVHGISMVCSVATFNQEFNNARILYGWLDLSEQVQSRLIYFYQRELLY